jgi:hypothetical protein
LLAVAVYCSAVAVAVRLAGVRHRWLLNRSTVEAPRPRTGPGSRWDYGRRP